MIRIAFSSLGGVALALLLFWLLALLVVPPEADIDVREMAMPINLVEAPPGPEVEVAEAAWQASAMVTTEAGEPLPEPVSKVEAELRLPEPEQEPVSEPEPEPAPEPEPVPEPEPEPEPVPVERAVKAEPAASSPSREESSAETDILAEVGEEASDPGVDQPVNVGQATPVTRVPPDYPRRAQRRGIEGFVELEFLIRPDGSVDPQSIRVVDARPGNTFEGAAEQAVANWRFDADGRLRSARQRLEFQLR